MENIIVKILPSGAILALKLWFLSTIRPSFISKKQRPLDAIIQAEVTECLLTKDTRVVPCRVLVYLVSGTYWSITVASKIKPASNSQVSYTLLSPAKRFERDLNMSQAFKAKSIYCTHCCLCISLKYIDLAIHSGHIFDENKVKLFS